MPTSLFSSVELSSSSRDKHHSTLLSERRRFGQRFNDSEGQQAANHAETQVGRM